MNINDLKVLLDKRVYRDLEGHWRDLLTRIKWDTIKSALKSVAGLQGRKFKVRAGGRWAARALCEGFKRSALAGSGQGAMPDQGARACMHRLLTGQLGGASAMADGWSAVMHEPVLLQLGAL